MLKRLLLAAALAFAATATMAQQKSCVPGVPDAGFLTEDMTVTMAAAGGKFSLREMREIQRGEQCKLDKDSIAFKVEDDGGSHVMVRYFTWAQTKEKHCPAYTPFLIERKKWDAAVDACQRATSDLMSKMKGWFGQ